MATICFSLKSFCLSPFFALSCSNSKNKVGACLKNVIYYSKKSQKDVSLVSLRKKLENESTPQKSESISLFFGMKFEEKDKKNDTKYLSKQQSFVNDPHMNFRSAVANRKEIDLGIFNFEKKIAKEICVNLYDKLETKENICSIKRLPLNAAEEMIEWTKLGIAWNFPIDNEQYIKDEKNVSFHEHVFLEHHLSKFPNKGPVRHFMELMLVGLSKNPHMSIKEKIAHIDWFKHYFKTKGNVLESSVI